MLNHLSTAWQFATNLWDLAAVWTANWIIRRPYLCPEVQAHLSPALGDPARDLEGPEVRDGAIRSAVLDLSPSHLRPVLEAGQDLDPAAWNMLRNQPTRWPLHPAILDLIENRGIMPAAAVQVLTEWPHRAATNPDPAAVAFARDLRAVREDRQTVTRLGRYVLRLWPDMPSREVELLIAKHCNLPHLSYRLVTGPQLEAVMADLADGTIRGPRSCMSSVGYVKTSIGEVHPYASYARAPQVDGAPQWGLALAELPGDGIMARGVVHLGSKTYARLYRRDPANPETVRADDPGLAGWLQAQGFRHTGEYPEGATLWTAPVGRDGEAILCPWIDGANHRGMVRDDVIVIRNSGPLDLQNTSGFAEFEDDHTGQVEDHSGNWIDEDEAVEYRGDYWHIHDCVEDLAGDWVPDRVAVYCEPLDAYLDPRHAHRTPSGVVMPDRNHYGTTDEFVRLADLGADESVHRAFPSGDGRYWSTEDAAREADQVLASDAWDAAFAAANEAHEDWERAQGALAQACERARQTRAALAQAAAVARAAGLEVTALDWAVARGVQL